MLKFEKLLKEESIRYPSYKDGLSKEPATQEWMKSKLKLSYFPHYKDFEVTVRKRFPSTPDSEIKIAWDMKDGMNEEFDEDGFDGNDEQLIENLLKDLLEESGEFDQDGVRTFEDDGVMTRNKGLVIKFHGKKYQLEIKS